MGHSELTYLSANGRTNIHADLWQPDGREIKGVVQLVHGVGEYAARYAPFAEFLCGHGYVVCGNDHLGHGHSIIEDCPPMYFGETDGWQTVVADVETLRGRMAAQYPDKPYFLFGHSMGSFLTRSHMIRYPGACTGYVLCGTGHPARLLLGVGKKIVAHEAKKCGKKTVKPQFDKLVFGTFNKKFMPNKTPNDWLSANEDNVRRYIADPLIQTETTLGMFGDLCDGLDYITNPDNFGRIDKRRPVLLIAGQEDPVGNMGRDVEKVCGLFKKLGLSDVQMKLYPGMRHEILNEKEREKPFDDVLNWLEEHR